MAIKLVPIQLLLHAVTTISILFHCIASLSPNYFCSHPLINVHSESYHLFHFVLSWKLSYERKYWSFTSHISEAVWAKSQFLTSRIVSLLIKDTHHKNGVGRGDTLLFFLCWNKIQSPLKKMRKDKMLRCENSKHFYSQTNMKKPLP